MSARVIAVARDGAHRFSKPPVDAIRLLAGLVRKSGIMSVVLAGGDVRTGDPIIVELPPAPHNPLERV